MNSIYINAKSHHANWKVCEILLLPIFYNMSGNPSPAHLLAKGQSRLDVIDGRLNGDYIREIAIEQLALHETLCI
jgi:hypothetical protein